MMPPLSLSKGLLCSYFSRILDAFWFIETLDFEVAIVFHKICQEINNWKTQYKIEKTLFKTLLKSSRIVFLIKALKSQWLKIKHK